MPNHATLLIVDRVDDIAPALLHDISYASLVIDLLKHDPCTVGGGSQRYEGVCGGCAAPGCPLIVDSVVGVVVVVVVS